MENMRNAYTVLVGKEAIDKVVDVLNYAIGVWGIGWIDPCFFDLVTKWR